MGSTTAAGVYDYPNTNQSSRQPLPAPSQVNVPYNQVPHTSSTLTALPLQATVPVVASSMHPAPQIQGKAPVVASLSAQQIPQMQAQKQWSQQFQQQQTWQQQQTQQPHEQAQQQQPHQEAAYPEAAIADKWLGLAKASIEKGTILTAPAIASNYKFKMPQGIPIYPPESVWTIRYMTPRQRKELYDEMCAYASIMLDKGANSREYCVAFQIVMDRSLEVATRERNWYHSWNDPRYGDTQFRNQEYATLVAKQAEVTAENAFGPAPPAVASASSKAASLLQVSTPGASLGSTPEAPITVEGDTPVTRDPASWDTTRPQGSRGKKRVVEADEDTEETREAKKRKIDEKMAAEYEVYMRYKDTIDVAYISVGHNSQLRRASDHWYQKLEAWANPRRIEAAKTSGLPNPHANPVPPRKQDQAYPGDTRECPRLPSRDLRDYPVKSRDAETYYCLHFDAACRGNSNCTIAMHDCCRTGYSLRSLERQVVAREQRTCVAIEKLVIAKKLDVRHKTWDGFFDPTLRNIHARGTPKPKVEPICWTEQSQKLASRRLARKARQASATPVEQREAVAPAHSYVATSAEGVGEDVNLLLQGEIREGDASSSEEIRSQDPISGDDEVAMAILKGLEESDDEEGEGELETAIVQGMMDNGMEEEESSSGGDSLFGDDSVDGQALDSEKDLEASILAGLMDGSEDEAGEEEASSGDLDFSGELEIIYPV